MLIYVGVTDYQWYKTLKSLDTDEVNFWQPNTDRNFRAIHEGELFLFKLHSPNNFIVGGGVFTRQVFMPLSLTWDAFGIKNGVSGRTEFLQRICKYRRTDLRTMPDPIVSSLILTSPFFLEEEEWMPIPNDWSSNIVQGKVYNTDTYEGMRLHDFVQRHMLPQQITVSESVRFGKPTTILPRLGQGSFRVIVTDSYHKRCAISGEKTLPVLDAAHIKPFAENGPHLVRNGLLLRQDIHTLFDRGYMTINEEYIVEVSKRIKEDFGNGKEYYAFHGKKINNIPDRADERPAKDFLLWHNEIVYMG